jgi:Holliday junction resolvase RusA-like endonuclease
MTKFLSLYISEPPQGKARAQTATLPDGKGGVRMTKGKNGKSRPVLIHHTPEKTRKYEARISTIAAAKMRKKKLRRLEGPVKIRLLFVMPKAKSWPRWKRELAESGEMVPTTTPDADNIEKALKDGFNAVVWRDDCQVVGCVKDKMYERPGLPVGVYCQVFALDKYPAQITKKPQPEGWDL